MRTRINTLILIIGLMAGLQIAAAQQTLNYACLSGRVTDLSGTPVDGADVTARQMDTNLTSTLQSDREGRFSLP